MFIINFILFVRVYGYRYIYIKKWYRVFGVIENIIGLSCRIKIFWLKNVLLN